MVARAKAFGVAAVVLVVSACGNLGTGEAGTGRLETIEPDVTEFTRLVAEVAFDVTVGVGDGFDLVVRADDNVIDDVKASVSGETLTLGLAGSYRDVTLEADLEVPADALSAISTSGAARVTASDELTSDGFDVDANGASDVTVPLRTDDLTVSASGASTIEVSGSGDQIDANADGGSTLRLAEFTASIASARADGASTIDITVSDVLDAEASGASTIRYGGNPPDVSQTASGASAIEPN